MMAQQAQQDFQDEKMKDALNYANLIQNVENIGKLNQRPTPDLRPAARYMSGQDSASATGSLREPGDDMNLRPQLSANMEEKNKWLLYEK